MEQHARDLLTLMIWAFSTLGAGAVAVAIWGGKKVLFRLEAIETLLTSEVKTLRELLHEHEIRLVKIESNCHHFHANAPIGPTPGRRHGDDPQRIAFPDYPD